MIAKIFRLLKHERSLRRNNIKIDSNGKKSIFNRGLLHLASRSLVKRRHCSARYSATANRPAWEASSNTAVVALR